jgi:hypothetical protein
MWCGGGLALARLVVDGHRYDGLSSSAFLEREYERLIVQEADQLFPGLRVVTFNEPVQHDGVWKKPDLALLDPECRVWWVGEVELAHHSFRSHVLPQIEVLARGDYGDRHAAALSAVAPDIDPTRIRAMLRGAQPTVAVIVNEPSQEWRAPLAREGAVLVIVEVFRSPARLPVFRINGHELVIPGDVLTTCRVDPLMPRMLRVDAPGALAFDSDTEIEIAYRGSITRWRLFATADRTYRSPVRGSPWPEGSTLRIISGQDGRLTFDLET